MVAFTQASHPGERRKPQVRDEGPSLTPEVSMLEPLPRGPAGLPGLHRLIPFLPAEVEDPRSHRVQGPPLSTRGWLDPSTIPGLGAQQRRGERG